MSAIARLKAILGLDANKYKQEVKSAGKETSTFQKKLGAMGSVLKSAFAVGAVSVLANKFKEFAISASLSAENVSVTTAQMLALNDVFSQSNLTMDDTAKLLGKLQYAQDQAISGMTEYADSFERWGISMEDLVALDPVSLLELVAQKAQETATPTAMLADIFGERLGPKTTAALKQLAEEGLGKLSEEAARAADEIRAADDAFTRWKNRVKVGAAEMIASIGKLYDKYKKFVELRAERAANNMKGDTKIERLGSFLKNYFSPKGVYTDAAEASQAVDERYDKANEQRENEQQDRAARAAAERREILNSAGDEQTIKAKEARDKLKAEIRKLNEQIDPENKKVGSGVSTKKDSIREIGGVIGRDLPDFSVMNRQLSEMERIRQIQERMEELTQQLVDQQTGGY